MKEIVKLMLSVEWMNKKGVLFDSKWITELSSPKQKLMPEVENMKLQPWLTKQLPDLNKTYGFRQIMDICQISKDIADPMSVRLEEKSVTETTVSIKAKGTFRIPHADIDMAITQKWKASINDYDHLYGDMNPNAPIGMDLYGKPYTPNVKTWSELYRRSTEPVPCVLLQQSVGFKINRACKGCVSLKDLQVESVAFKHKEHQACSVQEGVYKKIW